MWLHVVCDGSDYTRSNLNGLKNFFFFLAAWTCPLNSQRLFWQIHFMSSSPQTQFLHEPLFDTSDWREEPSTAQIEVDSAHSWTGRILQQFLNDSLAPSASLEERVRRLDPGPTTSLSQAGRPRPTEAPGSSPAPPAFRQLPSVHPSPTQHSSHVFLLCVCVMCVYLSQVFTSTISLTSQCFSRPSSFSWAAPTTLSDLKRPL